MVTTGSRSSRWPQRTEKETLQRCLVKRLGKETGSKKVELKWKIKFAEWTRATLPKQVNLEICWVKRARCGKIYRIWYLKQNKQKT